MRAHLLRSGWNTVEAVPLMSAFSLSHYNNKIKCWSAKCRWFFVGSGKERMIVEEGLKYAEENVNWVGYSDVVAVRVMNIIVYNFFKKKRWKYCYRTVMSTSNIRPKHHWCVPLLVLLYRNHVLCSGVSHHLLYCSDHWWRAMPWGVEKTVKCIRIRTHHSWVYHVCALICHGRVEPLLLPQSLSIGNVADVLQLCSVA